MLEYSYHPNRLAYRLVQKFVIPLSIILPILINAQMVPMGGVGQGGQAYGPQPPLYPMAPTIPRGSIYDQIISDPELSMFRKAIDMEGLSKEFLDPNIELTVLAPTDIAVMLAFHSFPSFKLSAYVLRDHFVKGLLTSSLMISSPNKSYETLGYGKVWNSVGTTFNPFASYDTSSSFNYNSQNLATFGQAYFPGSNLFSGTSAGNYEFYMNSAKIIGIGTKVGNGVLHKIDRVIFPSGRSATIRRFIKENPNLSDLNSIGIDESLLRLIDSEVQQFTIFLPSNQALRKLPYMDRNLFNKLFRAHIIYNQVLFSRVLSTGTRYTTALGEISGQLKLYVQTRGLGDVPILPWQNNFQPHGGSYGISSNLDGRDYNSRQGNNGFESVRDYLVHPAGNRQSPATYPHGVAGSDSNSNVNNRYHIPLPPIQTGANNYRTGDNSIDFGRSQQQQQLNYQQQQLLSHQQQQQQQLNPLSPPMPPGSRRYRSMVAGNNKPVASNVTSSITSAQAVSSLDAKSRKIRAFQVRNGPQVSSNERYAQQMGPQEYQRIPDSQNRRVETAPYGFKTAAELQAHEEQLMRDNPQLRGGYTNPTAGNAYITNPRNPYGDNSIGTGANVGLNAQTGIRNRYGGAGSQYGPVNGGMDYAPLEYHVVSESTSRSNQILEGSVYAKIEIADIPLSNGVVHIIDNVLAHVYQPIGLYLQTNRNLSQFMGMLRDTPDLLRLLDTGRDVTVFAPTDAAFQKVPPNIYRERVRGNPNALQQLLRMHIVANQKVLTSGLTNETEVPSLQEGQTLSFTVYNQQSGYTFVKGGGVMAYIIQPNVGVTNGIVHVIDSVLGLPFLDAFSYIQTNPQLTHLYPLIIQSDETVDFAQKDKRFTYFLPSSEALQTFANQYPDKFQILRSYSSKMRYLLRNHILDYAIPLNDRATEQLYYNINRNKLKISLNPWTNERTVSYGTAQARILQSDIETTNGLINIIDTVLFIPADIQNSAQIFCSNVLFSIASTLTITILTFKSLV